jgi:hypothetical protein
MKHFDLPDCIPHPTAPSAAAAASGWLLTAVRYGGLLLVVCASATGLKRKLRTFDRRPCTRARAQRFCIVCQGETGRPCFLVPAQGMQDSWGTHSHMGHTQSHGTAGTWGIWDT